MNAARPGHARLLGSGLGHAAAQVLLAERLAVGCAEDQIVASTPGCALRVSCALTPASFTRSIVAIVRLRIAQERPIDRFLASQQKTAEETRCDYHGETPSALYAIEPGNISWSFSECCANGILKAERAAGLW